MRLFTSSRDEKSTRSKSVPPDMYSFPGGKVVYPKDSDAGGTWMALHENGNTVVLLNGAFFKHQHQPPYRHSRGLVVLKLIQEPDPFSAFKQFPLARIEPFTLVMMSESQLYECRWDGETRFFKSMDAAKPCIWSSVTLYDEKTVAKRRDWFQQWLHNRPRISQEDMLQFHEFTGDGDSENDLRMNRNDELLTVSITSFALYEQRVITQHRDLLAGQQYNQEWPLQQTTVS